MPCCKKTISKTLRCDKEGCFCLPTDGKPCLCLCENETGDIISCDCRCDGATCKCDDKCICINTEGYTCICVCRDEKGNINTCGNCSCKTENKQCSKSNQSSADICDEGCKCCNAKQTHKDSSSKKTTCEGVYGTSKACQGNCQCQGNEKSCVCVCKNEKGEWVCCNDCKCDATNTCGKEGCSCVSVESVKDIGVLSKNSCCESAAKSGVCVCKNEKGELVCCNDCKCDGTSTCGKEGCSCVSVESGKDIGVLSKNNCCESAAKSGVCVCKNEKGELVCCNDCKCDVTNTCGKEGCSCVSIETVKDIGVLSKNSCCESAAKSGVCVCKNEKGELVCCNDCKCDGTSTCGKEGCSCVSVESGKDIGVLSNNTCCESATKTCVCVCKNEKGELVCCNDCKCDATNTCNNEGCSFVSTKSVKDIE